MSKSSKKPRRSVTLDPNLIERMDAAITAGAAPSVSAFIEDALACYLAELDRRKLVEAARRLDPHHETRLLAAVSAIEQSAGWDRLR
ncbi:MAG: ribbon-helix-helix domain-containing protein [Nitriliruptorales bacterium]